MVLLSTLSKFLPVNILLTIINDYGPLTLIIDIPPIPIAVLIAHIVSSI